METGVAQIDSIQLCLHVFLILPVYLVSEHGTSHRAVCTEEESAQHRQFQVRTHSFWTVSNLPCVDERLTKHHLTAVLCS